MEQELQQTVALLARTPVALNALLRDLPKAWTLCDEGEHTWSAFDIVCHLIHAERADWIPRVRFILQLGESQTFEPFDRSGNIREMRDKQLDQLLDGFSRLRSESLSELQALDLQKDDLRLRGRHPSLGVVTLSELMATWAVHDLTHLHQISRVLAHQYREAVGPWSGYLGVLQCAGHSSR